MRQDYCVIECQECGARRESRAEAAWAEPEKTLDTTSNKVVKGKHKKPPGPAGGVGRQADTSPVAISLIDIQSRKRAGKMAEPLFRPRVVGGPREQRKWRAVVPLSLVGSAAFGWLLWQFARLLL